MKGIVTAALVLIAASGSMAQGLGYKGAPFGATKDEFLARHPGLKCTDPGARFRMLGDEICEPELTSANLANLPAFGTYAGQSIRSPSFGLVDGKFARFGASFAPSQYEAIRDAMKAGIGQGTETTQTFQTRGGASVQSRNFTIKRPDGVIDLLEHASSLNEGAIAGRSAEYERFQNRLQQDAAKSGSKDL